MNYHRQWQITLAMRFGNRITFFQNLSWFNAGSKISSETIGRVARSAPVRSAGKALKKEVTKAAVETALEALEDQPVSRKAKQRLKSATRVILLNAARQADTNNEYRSQNSSRKRKTPSIAQSRKKRRRITKQPLF